MAQTRQQLVEDLFHAALDKGSDYLQEACGGDAELMAEVAALVDSYYKMLDVEGPSEKSGASVSRFGACRFGAYQGDEILGSGGMGTVFRAHRVDGQFSQQVAIKVLRGSLRSEWFRRRFLAEREILARLNHPNVARLLDGGATEDGEPYLVMELVEGEPIDAYCDRRKWTVEQRVDLFVQVLDAVDYAHRSLVVHRDLKPGNILVTAEGQVKLLDFGTSRMTEADDTATSLRAFTPRYASPEQLRGEPASVASDVFSAGVVLYELLAGAYPYGETESVVKSLERATGMAGPLVPSDQVTEISAGARSSSLPSLRQVLAGDLSSVLLKSLNGETDRRYLSIAAFREDLARYRSGRAVEAKPSTFAYLTGKFVRRHRWAVAAGVIFVLGLSGAAGIALVQARSARHEAQRAERINAFMNDMLGAADPRWYNPLRTKGPGVTLVDVISEMRGRIGKELGDDPEVEIRLRRTIGRMLGALGKHVESREELEIALALQLKLTGSNHPDAGIAFKELAGEDYLTQRSAEGEKNATLAVEILTRFARPQDTEPLMEAYNFLGLCRYGNGRSFEEVEDAIQKSLVLSRQLYGEGGSTPVGLGVLATMLVMQGKFDSAEELIKEAIKAYRKRPGPPPLELGTALRDSGLICLERKDYACAESQLGEALEIQQKNSSSENMYIWRVQMALALVRGVAHGDREADQALEAVAGKIAAAGGSSSPLYLAGVDDARARVHMAQGRAAAAEPYFRKALAFYGKNRRNPARDAVVESRLGECLGVLGKKDEARSLLAQSYQQLVESLGPDHVWTRDAKVRLDGLQG